MELTCIQGYHIRNISMSAVQHLKHNDLLKGHNQVKIIQKSVILVFGNSRISYFGHACPK